MARLLELDTAVAAGFGAADAWVSTKAGAGPGGVPWAVILELGGVAGGMFGGRIGLSAAVEDGLMASAVSQLVARLTRAGMAGTLSRGPSAWGGVGAGAYHPTAARATRGASHHGARGGMDAGGFEGGMVEGGLIEARRFDPYSSVARTWADRSAAGLTGAYMERAGAAG